MAIRINVNNLEEIKKKIEEDRIFIDRLSQDLIREMASFGSGPGSDRYREYFDAASDHREDAREYSLWGIDLSEDAPAILEARAGEDGIFRVEQEINIKETREEARRSLGGYINPDPC